LEEYAGNHGNIGQAQPWEGDERWSHMPCTCCLMLPPYLYISIPTNIKTNSPFAIITLSTNIFIIVPFTTKAKTEAVPLHAMMALGGEEV
jgi:hypothetical protein